MQEIILIDFLNLNDKEIIIIHKWRNDERIRKWMFDSKLISIDEHISFISSLKSTTTKKYFLVKCGYEYLGVITFKNTNLILKQCHIGLYSNPNKKGVGTILIKQCIKYAFKLMKLKKLIIQVFTLNKNAIKLYNKIGFIEIKRETYQEKELIYMELNN